MDWKSALHSLFRHFGSDAKALRGSLPGARWRQSGPIQPTWSLDEGIGAATYPDSADGHNLSS